MSATELLRLDRTGDLYEILTIEAASFTTERPALAEVTA